MIIDPKPGMRVRCVDASGFHQLVRGKEYMLAHVDGPWVGFDTEQNAGWHHDRFKPIVRVKAPCIPSFDLLVKRAVAAVDLMTPEQQAAHWQAQRESFVRGNLGVD